VDGDQIPVVLVLSIGRKARVIDEKMSLWCETRPEATPGERVETWWVVVIAEAQGASGLFKRRVVRGEPA
jgi:hypothetical protein